MKNSNDFDLNTNKNDNDAQAVKKSELLPIFEGMKFSGDIQPLEAISISDYEKTDISDEKNDLQKSDVKKKRRSVFPILNIKHKKNKNFCHLLQKV